MEPTVNVIARAVQSGNTEEADRVLQESMDCAAGMAREAECRRVRRIIERHRDDTRTSDGGETSREYCEAVETTVNLILADIDRADPPADESAPENLTIPL